MLGSNTLGIGDCARVARWGLGIGIPSPRSPVPDPQSPIPSPQSPAIRPQSRASPPRMGYNHSHRDQLSYEVPVTSQPPAINVDHLQKSFIVPEREAGLRAAMKSLVRRKSKEVKA